MPTRCRFMLYGLLGMLLPAVASGADEVRTRDVESSEPSSAAARVISFERLLDDCATATPGELWERVMHSGFELASHSRHRKGFFEFYAFPADLHDRKLAIICDDRVGHRIVLIPDQGALPARISINDRTLVVGDSGGWELYKHQAWVAAFDENHTRHFSDPSGVPSDPHGFIKFGLPSFLSGVVANDNPDVTWDTSSRTLTAQKTSGTEICLRFRTPHDQRRFGTLLGELGIRSSSGNLSHRCFIVDRESPLRVNLTDIDALPERLEALDLTETEDSPGWPRLDTPAKQLEAARLRLEIGLLECEEDREATTSLVSSRFQERLIELILISRQRRDRIKQVGGGNGETDSNAFVDSLVSELEIAYASIEAAIVQDDVDPVVDDPSILWLGFERALFPFWATVFLADVVGEHLEAADVSLQTKIRLCQTIGEFGAPAWAPQRTLASGQHGQFLESILHARWNWVPTEDELTLCFSKLENEPANPLEREAAIDSLIRWGRLEAIPDEQMNDWFETKLAASRTHRHCTWKALTRTESGRRFLRARLEPLAPQIQREIADIFCHRARATLDMKRFDFMTEAECHETLRVCEPLSEGAESNAK